MSRLSPGAESYKLLYVRSGNVCAFPDCEHPIFNDEGLYIAQLCHIKAANEGGPRYDQSQTDEERRAIENLLFMCYRHHKETDDILKFPAEKLLEIKLNHESNYTEGGRRASEEMIRQVLEEDKYFWNRLSNRTYENIDLKISLDFEKDTLVVLDDINCLIGKLYNYTEQCVKSDSRDILFSDLNNLLNQVGLDISIFNDIPYYENPFENRNWEMHYLARPNIFSHLDLSVLLIRIKLLGIKLIENPNDEKLTNSINIAREEFEKKYERAYYHD